MPYDVPKIMQTSLASLFPAAVVVAELTTEASTDVLTESELKSISHCAKKRIQDFTRGRACAHEALRQLGFTNFSVLSGEKREPLWPAEIVGSITHTTGFAAAVAARQSQIQSLGIDCEVVESVGRDLWERICTPAEQARLALLPEAEAQKQAALIFAAKEAFYKCQFPLSRQWVGFEDVSIVVEAESWRVVAENPLPVATPWIEKLVGRYEFRERWVIAGIYCRV